MTKKLITIATLLMLLSICSAQTVFNHQFAPSEGLVSVLEKPYREEICLNGMWDFRADSDNEWDATKIRIPSPWIVNSFSNENLEGQDHRNYPSYAKRWVSIVDAWMKKNVTIPEDWNGNRIILHFEAVAGRTEVFVNNRLVAENSDIFLPFEADLTDIVTPGQEVEILVHVRASKLFDEPSAVGRRTLPAGSMWGIQISGIWQDVYLLKRPEIHISDIYIHPQVSVKNLKLEVAITNNSSKDKKITLEGTVHEWLNKAATDITGAPVPAWDLGLKALDVPKIKYTAKAGSTDKVTIDIPIENLKFWTPENPNLYGLQLNIKEGKKVIDNSYERFGWREWTFAGTDLLLNGEKISLRGDSWHFTGIPMMSRRYAWSWYTAIKDMNGNAVRLHAQVYPRFYMDMADEMGICLLEETANWASDGGPKLDSKEFWENSKDHLRRMVMRDRNHACIFGWSISNENKPVILHVYKRPDLIPQQEQAWRDWRAIVEECDPSRQWISSDGEEDGEGILPVTVGHYGDENSMRAWKAIGKPWGVGEHGMAYYGTPQEVAKYNGERAYESFEGRMEGIATESYRLIKSMREAGAAYSTVFNMAWYGLKPLPFGKKDLSTVPSIEEGIFFGPYIEGVPGVQPERIGPYSSTFNPGYDPALPLYEEWPMFDALRAANAPEGPAWSEWEKKEPKTMERVGPAPEEYESVIFVGNPDSKAARIFRAQGVIFTDKAKGKTLYIIDATQAQTLPDTKGADRWFWGLTPETAEQFGLDVTLHNLKRSSFLPTGKLWADGLKNSEFYFCEVQREHACRYSLSGRAVRDGIVLMNACRTEWRSWNKRAEQLKTAATLRSENENTAPLAVFIKYGNDYISTVDDFLSSEKGFKALKHLLENAGIKCGEVETGKYDHFDDGIYQSGLLTRPVN